ncbi:hypothetical protein O3P69_005477 [Scylla paramamosain]|uniref:Large ribosomal subunit protein bL28m n=1 Tax=Scylla paramamosain TaxID=85552 RepID=A0AAW0UDV6_SCYPA
MARTRPLIWSALPNKHKTNMAQRRSAQFIREMITRPWNTMSVFQQDNHLSRVPDHYKKFFWEWKCVKPKPVHYVPTPGKFEQLPNGDILPVQNIPLPLKQPKELHQGIWGGEAVIKGFQKRKPNRRRVPHYWVPGVKNSVVYSEILDRHMTLTVTERTLKLIDDHYGFDNYILETPPADLMSQLALKIRREMLLALEEILQKYEKHIIPEEEAEWYGLNLLEASNKQKLLEEIANQPQPLKHRFRAEFVEYLKTMKQQQQEEKEAAAQEKQSLSPSSWLSKVNPFAKKQDE